MGSQEMFPDSRPRRLQAFPVLWAAAWPLRQYLLRSPFPRGKGFLIRRVLVPLLPPPPAMFRASLDSGDRLLLQHRELLGLAYLVYGSFERAEIACLSHHAAPGSFAFDVGAHVGIFAIPLARAVGSDGTVVALEPVGSNVSRLRQNLLENSIQNVVVRQAAAADYVGELRINVASDSAFHSAAEVHRDTEDRVSRKRRATLDSTTTPCVTLDRVWADAGEPRVSVMKIDVEGFELRVLAGATRLIDRCTPVILAEASTEAHRQRLAEWFADRNYRCTQPAGFVPWNHLFLPQTSVGAEGQM